MRDNKTFSLDQVLAALRKLAIAFEPIGAHAGNLLQFCSLRNPQAEGLYYFESHRALPAGDYRGSVFLAKAAIDTPGVVTLVVDYPQVAFYRLMQEFFGDDRASAGGVHATAVVDPEAEVHPNAYIGPYCVVGRATIGDGVRLHSHVVVFDGSVLESGVTVEPHSTIGATGVAWVMDPQTRQRIVQPQIGGVRIGRNSFIGSDVTVVRGSVNEVTALGESCVIAHGSKIGHGSRLGDEVHFANNVSVAGNVEIGDRSFLGSACALRPHVKLATGTVVGVGAAVVKDSLIPNQVLSGVPAKPMVRKAAMTGVPSGIEEKE